MPPHRLWMPDADPEAATLKVSGDEAQHAMRVKRLGVGDPVTVLTGRGEVIRAAIEQGAKDRGVWTLLLRVEAVERVPPLSPRVELWTAPPKGHRLEQLIDQASQAGAAEWSPLITERTVVEPGEGKLERLARVASESAKQSGRAWVMGIGAGGTLAEALRVPEGATVVLADASGDRCTPPATPRVRLLVGPEGGWTAEELARAGDAGVRVMSLGPHAMRIETAAVVGTAILLWGAGMAGRNPAERHGRSMPNTNEDPLGPEVRGPDCRE